MAKRKLKLTEESHAGGKDVEETSPASPVHAVPAAPPLEDPRWIETQIPNQLRALAADMDHQRIGVDLIQLKLTGIGEQVTKMVREKHGE